MSDKIITMSFCFFLPQYLKFNCNYIIIGPKRIELQRMWKKIQGHTMDVVNRAVEEKILCRSYKTQNIVNLQKKMFSWNKLDHFLAGKIPTCSINGQAYRGEITETISLVSWDWVLSWNPKASITLLNLLWRQFLVRRRWFMVPIIFL